MTVPQERAEAARAQMLELFPHGFEEVVSETSVELVGYTDSAGEEHFMHEFSGARSSEVELGWEERWRVFHKPVQIGPLWVGPPWERPPADVIPVVIDPGRAFGTGSHATTRLCLQHLIELAGEPHSLLDVGCGSGVLAIAASALGFEPVVAVDSDPAAVEATQANAARNGVTIEVALVDAAAAEPIDADVTVANISIEGVLALGPRLRSPLAITAGYLVSERPSLPGYRLVSRREVDAWAADLHARETP